MLRPLANPLVAREVDGSTVIFAGVTAANLFLHVARNFRRSSEVEIGFGVSVAMQLKTR
jgi:hypothetical protein